MISPRLAATLVILALLASCGTAHRRGTPSAGPVCDFGPDGAPPVADRGIGGTGAVADRGIGGTGIIGVITGFASICVNGLEVETNAQVPVLLDEDPVPAAALRAGQLVAIDATGSDSTLYARHIVVQHEVSGPVDAAAPDGALSVAGQRIAVAGRVWGRKPQVGDWVAVSGLRRPSGEIVATRIDQRTPGPVTVRGSLGRDAQGLHIGTLRVRPTAPQGVETSEGTFVTAIGHLDHGVLFASSITPDLFVTNPVAAFGPGVAQFVVEGYAEVTGKGLQLGAGLSVAAAPGLEGAPGWAIVKLQRHDDGSLLATSLRTIAPAAPTPMSPPNAAVPPAPSGAAGGPAGRNGTEGQPPEPAPIPSRGSPQGGVPGGSGPPSGAGSGPSGNMPGPGPAAPVGAMPAAGPPRMGAPGPRGPSR